MVIIIQGEMGARGQDSPTPILSKLANPERVTSMDIRLFLIRFCDIDKESDGGIR